jgi:23S rRNA (guanosine2251-2'-O)-methyltransferase
MIIARLPVIIVLDNVRSLYNTGAIFRTADACAVERLVLCGITPRPDQGVRQRHAIAKTALGAELSVPWEFEASTAEAVSRAAGAGYQVVVAETSERAVDLFEFTPRRPLCQVFGHEATGVTDEVLASASIHVRIPMFGHKESLNVATAAGVVLYELLRKHRYAQQLVPGQ